MCKDWLSEYSSTRAILYAVSASITLINFLLRFFIRTTAEFEAHHDATMKLRSTTTKMWIVQFIATGVILTLINADWSEVDLPDNFPILSGEYSDFSIDWYSTVGSTICLTCFINIVMPLTNFGFLFLAWAKRCYDMSCGFDESRTKQVLQSKYEDLYTGPYMLMADRYA